MTQSDQLFVFTLLLTSAVPLALAMIRSLQKKRPFSLPAPLQRASRLILPIGALASFALLTYTTLDAYSGPTLQITKDFGGPITREVDSGQEFIYYIAYRCASITQDCVDATLIDPLPPELVYIEAIGPIGDIESINYDSGSHSVVVDFVDPLGAGTTGIIEIIVKFPPGTLPDTQAINQATSTTAAGIETSDVVTATATGSFEMFIDKRVANDIDDAVIGSDFTTNYTLQVCNPDEIGGVRLTNPTIVDALPAEATFVSASNNGVYDPVNHTITWTAPDLPDPVPVTDDCAINLNVQVRFNLNGPDNIPGNADDPIAGIDVTNVMTLTGLTEEYFPVTQVDPVTISLIDPYFDDNSGKSASSPSTYTARPIEELPDGLVQYTLTYRNMGTITATDVMITDVIPSGILVTAIEMPRFLEPINGYYEVTDNPGVWIPFPGNSYAISETVAVTTAVTATPNDIELSPGTAVSGIRWEVGTVSYLTPPWEATIFGIIDPTASVGDRPENCMTHTANYTHTIAQTSTKTNCVEITVIDPRAIPRVNKTTTQNSMLPGEITQFTLSIYNADVAHNNIIGPITLGDLLPERLELVVQDSSQQSGFRVPNAGELSSGAWFTLMSTNGAPSPTHVYTPTFNAQNDTYMGWTFAAPYEIPPGEQITIRYYARVMEYTTPREMDNTAVLLWDPTTINPLPCDASDGNNVFTDTIDIDWDGNTTEAGCQRATAVQVEAFLAMDSQKFVQGNLQDGWKAYDYTVTGGDVDYRMVITNTSNITATNIIAYDIFPFPGDTGTIDNAKRGSEWRPYLIAPITDTQGLPLTISYSQSSNPCRTELLKKGPAGCVDDWSLTPPDDITTVRAIRLEFCDPTGTTCLELPPDDGTGGGSLSFSWNMVAPNSTMPEEVAWNSFGFVAEGGGLKLLPSEPIRVGIEVITNTLPGVSIGDYIWLDLRGQQNDGIQQPEEEGINGVRVELWNANTNTLVDFRTTGPDANDNGGYYEFINIPADDYYIRFFKPQGPLNYTFSPGNQGADDALDSDGVISGDDPTHGDYLQTNDFSVGASDDFTLDQGMWLATDYGDAPASYPVEAASQANPADAGRHIIDSQIYLGSSVDPELDGQPGNDALGDDTASSPDDEDGVTFEHYGGTAVQPTGLFILGENGQVTIRTVNSNPLTTTFLQGWIDFNGDGNWNAPNEQIITNRIANNSNADITFSIPATVTGGTTYARFRLSTVEDLGPTGTAPNGEVEDYRVQFISPPEKRIIATSEDHTDNDRLAVGEIVRYELIASVPEGSSSNFTIVDQLPNNLQFLDDGSLSVSVTATTGITWSQFLVNGAPFTSGKDVTFDLGTVTNSDNDTGEEFIVIQLNALALNNSGNTASKRLNNRMSVSFDSFSQTTDNVSVWIVEPDISLTKSILTPPSNVGDAIVYQLTATNSSGTWIESGFDLSITDTLDSRLTMTGYEITAPGYAVITDSTNIPTNKFSIVVDRLDPGDSITAVLTATVSTSMPVGETIDNTGYLLFSSLPITGTQTNPTGSTTPGDSGDGTGERNGDGGLNDHFDTADAPITLNTPAFEKTVARSSYTIGEPVTYTLMITLPFGTTQDLFITDDLPEGLSYQSHQIISTAAASNGRLANDFNGTLPTPTITNTGGSGVDLYFDFGDTVVNGGSATDDNRFLIEITAVVLNELGNQNGDTLNNQGILTYTRNGSSSSLTDDVDITLLEPVLEISKQLQTPVPAPIVLGTVITYELVLEHAPGSTADAFDIVLTDSIPADLINSTLISVTASGIPTPTADLTGNLLRLPDSGTLDLPQGAVVTITLSTEIGSTAVPNQPITNTAAATWSTLDGTPPQERDGGGEPDGIDPLDGGALDDYEVDDTAVVTRLIPDLTLTKTDGQLTARSGETLTYTLTISNVGTAPASGVIITETVPLNTTFAGPGGWTCTPDGSAGSTCTYAVGTLADGANTAVPFSILVDAPLPNFTASITNTAVVGDDGSKGPDPTPDNNDDDDVDTINAAIGDRIWLDTNANGIQDGGETGLNGVTVLLLDVTSTPIMTTTTNTSGVYGFTDLPPGDYAIRVLPPAGYTISSPDQGGDDTTDSDIDPASGTTILTTLSAGEVDPSWDAGLYQFATIGDTVWYDLNNNGVQDGGAEIGLFGVTVDLYDGSNTFITTTTTNASGIYSFTNLVPGTYHIDITPRAGYSISPRDQGGNDTADSDIDPTSGETINTVLTSGENDPTWDGGLFAQPASIGNYIWLDADQDGIQDGDEFGLENIAVALYDSAQNLISTTTTNPLGRYSFVNLPPGSYYVDVTVPGGYTVTSQDQGGNDATDSDIDPTTGETAVTTLSPGENDPTWDGGLYVAPASIGNYVWLDANQDGIQDSDELGINGVTVTLYDDSGTLLDTTTTDYTGFYQFTNLPPGDYYVDVTPPAGYTITGRDQGGDDTADSDIDPTTGETAVTTLTAGEDDPTWDAGLYILPASLGDTVWLDADMDGIQDSIESGVSGAVVRLYDSSNNLIDSTTTDGSGNYLFGNLPPGNYAVGFELPANTLFTTQNSGANDAVDSDANPTTGRTVTTTLVSGENDLSWDAGIVPATARLGDTVWRDLDADGIQEFDEPGVAGVQVVLYDVTDTPILTTTTNASGFYEFDNLGPGSYAVGFTLPAGFTFTVPNSGADDTADSDADMSTGKTAVTTLTSGENDPTWDAGLVQLYSPTTASLGNYVWEDLDGDGLQEPGEPGIPGITVTLTLSGTGVISTTTTDSDGLYEFINLTPDIYHVTFTAPAGYTFTLQDQGPDNLIDSDADPVTGQTVTTNLTAGQNDITWDAGLVQMLNPALAAIGNYVWYDSDRDGIQDVSETGIGGVTVNLYNSSNTVIDSTTTDGNGLYQFIDLPPGDYYVAFVPPANHILSDRDQGADDARDSDAEASPFSATYGQTAVTTLTAGENDPTWDAGMYIPSAPTTASLGNYVWEDVDADGVQDIGETGVSNVTVNLYSGVGALVDTTQTDVSGYYTFTNLLPGDYSVEFVPPAGYLLTYADSAGNDLDDSDANPATGRTITTTLLAGENDPSWDAGLYQPVRLGNRVWFDVNNDGVYTGTESSVADVRLELLDGNGNPVLSPITGNPITTTTTVSGTYAFIGIPEGTYIVRVAADNFDDWNDPLYGFVSSLNEQTVDPVVDPDADDSDVDDNGRNHPDPRLHGIESDPVTLTLGGEPTSDSADEDGALPDTDSNLTVDFGFFELLTLGNFIWFDTDRNSGIDAGEPGAPGVIVNLLQQNGDPVLHPVTNQPITTTTNGDGFYQFTNLYPGLYRVEVDAVNFQAGNILAGYVSSSGGSDPDDDSDVDDNGLDDPDPATNGIRSLPVFLDFDLEPDSFADSDDNNNTNLTVDMGFVSAPTAVSLTSFTAKLVSGNQVRLEWVTESELDNFGFRVYHSQTNSFATATQIHFVPTAVPGGTGPGTTYSYIDSAPSGTSYYWLVDIETDGQTGLHGPVRVTITPINFVYLPLMQRP